MKAVLEKYGFVFESDTDTEAVAKLAKYVYDTHKKSSGRVPSFTAVVKAVCKELVCFSDLRRRGRLIGVCRKVLLR